MNAVQTISPPAHTQSKRDKRKETLNDKFPPPDILSEPLSAEDLLLEENLNRWPSDILDAYSRSRGPYTAENAAMILEEEPVELFNGWLVWQAMTNLIERRNVANLQEMLSLSARNLDFGQALPDQVECLLSNGDVVKPDVCLLSWQRLANDIHYSGRRKRPLLDGGPELVIEVRSPSNRRGQEKSKRTLYFKNKVKVIWDVDDQKQLIWVYRAEAPETPTQFSQDDFIDCEPFLPGWRRRLSDIFAAQASAKVIAGEVAEEWRAEGFAEGENSGIAKTLREILPMLLQAHFRVPLPDDLAARLALCDLTQLQALQTSLTSSQTLDHWLALLPAPSMEAV